MVGKGGKAAVGGCMGVVIKRIPLFATCTGTNEGMNEVMGEMMMPCLSRDLCALDEMNALWLLMMMMDNLLWLSHGQKRNGKVHLGCPMDT